MACLIKPLPFKPPRLIGISEALTADHYGREYGAAVRRLDDLDRQPAEIDTLTTDRRDAAAGEVRSQSTATLELKRAQVMAANDVLLHEVYFDSLGGEDGLGSPAVDPAGELVAAITRDFGNVESWRREFVSLAQAADTGWLVLNWSPRQRKLHNDPIVEGSPGRIGSIPLIVLDLHRHAYAADFGDATFDYIEAFMTNLHWGRAVVRFEAGMSLTDRASIDMADCLIDKDATTIGPEQLRAALAAGTDVTLLDVCLPDDLSQRHDRLPGALCCRSDRIDDAIKTLPRDKPIIAYCIYGFQVSSHAVTELRRNGFDAKALGGGLASWRAIGGVTEDYAG